MFKLMEATMNAKQMGQLLARQSNNAVFPAVIGQLAHKYMGFVNSDTLSDAKAVFLGSVIAEVQEQLPELMIVPVAPPSKNSKPLDVEYVEQQ
jgi:hypothetical protein